MKFISKEEVLEALKKKYGDLDNTCGCSVSTGNGYQWLSVADIVDIIESCEEYED